MSNRLFSDVKFVAEQVPELHRTLNNDHTITTQELPGMVDVYIVIDGGRLKFTQLRGSDVLEAIELAGKQQTPPPEPVPPPATPAPETPQA